MLELNNIIKNYGEGDNIVRALRGIGLKFRKSEFVAILGPSGCGKTTLLNIIGGLDQYTSGDLIINNRTTKDFKDRDWDTYRNHSIGFVFQNYHLIPHQSVLRNVEIALTISGVSKHERKLRAISALEQVGLGDQINKRPNQLSGGQMQRVAIARALVNNPDIILADEPTGALDTETGIQVMEILKEVSEDRLVIMVTHNPMLADKYSSRTIRMLDGEIISDSRPLPKTESSKNINLENEDNKEEFNENIKNKKDRNKGKKTKEEKKQEKAERKRNKLKEKRRKNIEKNNKKTIKKEIKEKPSMSFATAFMLSLKNLFSKKGRTILTAFAGSIGIMGIALILAVSQGTTKYIQHVQEDALSSYPLRIEKESVDLTSLMEAFMNVGNTDIEHKRDAVYKKTAIYDMVTAFNSLESNENDLKSFKKYLEKEYRDKDEDLDKALTGLQYSYDLNLYTYTKNSEGEIIKSDTQELLQNLMVEHMGADASAMQNLRSNSSLSGLEDSMISNIPSGGLVNMNLWQEILPGKNGEPVNEVVKKQYDVIYGDWPEEYDEIVLVLDSNNELDDLTLYALGLESKENIDAIMKAAVDKIDVEKTDSKWTYEEIVDGEYRVILNSEIYTFDDKTNFYADLTKTESGLKYLYDNALKLKVTGIIRPNEDAQSTILSGAIGYTEGLTKYVVDKSKDSKIIEAQEKNKKIDILNGLPFKENTTDLNAKEKKKDFNEYVRTLSDSGKAEVYIEIMSMPSDKEIKDTVDNAMKGYKRKDIEETMIEGLVEAMNIDKSEVKDYITKMSDKELNELFAKSIEEQFKVQYAESVKSNLIYMDDQTLSYMLDEELKETKDTDFVKYYDEIIEFSESTYEKNLAKIGYVDLESPSVMNIFVSSFRNKDVIEDAIKKYNEDKPDLEQIKYTDYLGIMMSSITAIINAITYVLLAFVGISLIVSSIMIGVITLISVQERTKEIGILRAIGASKRNVSNMFNAETMIIGFVSGALGVGVTYLLSIPINIILHALTGINNLKAFLPMPAAIVLILISIILSLFAGLIPSRSAAKKDPVVALRTE